MDKKNIKKHLTSTFLSEDKKPVGLSNTEKVQADSKKFNNANQKEVAEEMKGYEKSLEKETEPVKYENSDSDKEYHEEMETMNGLEMNRFQNEPDKVFKERAEKAIAGDASMGNPPDYANVIPEDQAGFTGPKFGKKLVKKIKSSKEKRDKASELSNKNTTSVNATDFKDSSMKNEAPKSVAISENKINKKSKMKRLVFKKEFKGVGNALNVIPESYKVDGKEFHMTDGNEKYEIRWEGSLTEGRAIVLKASDKNLMNEDMENMKRLMGYKSQDTLGTVKGAARLDENKKFTDIWGKTKNIMTEMTSGPGFTGEGNLEGIHEDEREDIEKKNFDAVRGDIISKFGDSIITILDYFTEEIIGKFRINPDSTKFDLDDSNNKAISIGFSNINPDRTSNSNRFEIKINVDNGTGYTMLNFPAGKLIDGMIDKNSFHNLIDITYAAIEATGKDDVDKQAMKTSVINKLKGKIMKPKQTDEGMTEYGLSEQ